MSKVENKRMFQIISVILVVLFATIINLLVKTTTKENMVENICIMVLCLIIYVISNTLNICLYSIRKNLRGES